MTEFVAVTDLSQAVAKGGDFDAVVLVASDPAAVDVAAIRSAISAASDVDAAVGRSVVLLPVDALAGGRLVVAPTGPIDRDQDDVRRFADAAAVGVARARDAGSVRPLLLLAGVPAGGEFAHALPVAALAAGGALWQPLEAREALGAAQVEPIVKIGLAVVGGAVDDAVAGWVTAVDDGLRVTRDLCGTEPERMAPPRFAEYCEQAFAGLPVKVEVLGDADNLERDYPLSSAVARASLSIERHRPRIIRLEYEGEGPIERTILLAGKGITYDTGGADIKVGGGMAGMSRDKGGGAAVAGFVHAVASLKPKGVKVIAEIGAVRNSIGADSFVADEILTSHAGVRVRIGNTDAEGRLVLADLLSHLRERALQEVSPRLLSVATLTGHAARAMGPYTACLDNRPARELRVAETMGQQGDLWGDPCDVSRLRREDWDFVRPRTKADDLLSSNNGPSTGVARGHQFPMAFLAIAAGLDRHGSNSSQPLAYTHVDIAGSATVGGDWQHGTPTGRPLVAMLASLIEGATPA